MGSGTSLLIDVITALSARRSASAWIKDLGWSGLYQVIPLSVVVLETGKLSVPRSWPGVKMGWLMH